MSTAQGVIKAIIEGPLRNMLQNAFDSIPWGDMDGLNTAFGNVPSGILRAAMKMMKTNVKVM